MKVTIDLEENEAAKAIADWSAMMDDLKGKSKVSVAWASNGLLFIAVRCRTAQAALKSKGG